MCSSVIHTFCVHFFSLLLWTCVAEKAKQKGKVLVLMKCCVCYDALYST